MKHAVDNKPDDVSRACGKTPNEYYTEWHNFFYNNVEQYMRRKEDPLIALLHFMLIHLNFKCLGVGEDKTLTFRDQGTDMLPDNWNDFSRYSLRYSYCRQLYIVLGYATDSYLIVNLLNVKTRQVSNIRFLPERVVKESKCLKRKGPCPQMIEKPKEVAKRYCRELIDPVFWDISSEIHSKADLWKLSLFVSDEYELSRILSTSGDLYYQKYSKHNNFMESNAPRASMLDTALMKIVKRVDPTLCSRYQFLVSTRPFDVKIRKSVALQNIGADPTTKTTYTQAAREDEFRKNNWISKRQHIENAGALAHLPTASASKSNASSIERETAGRSFEMNTNLSTSGHDLAKAPPASRSMREQDGPSTSAYVAGSTEIGPSPSRFMYKPDRYYTSAPVDQPIEIKPALFMGNKSGVKIIKKTIVIRDDQPVRIEQVEQSKQDIPSKQGGHDGGVNRSVPSSGGAIGGAGGRRFSGGINSYNAQQGHRAPVQRSKAAPASSPKGVTPLTGRPKALAEAAVEKLRRLLSLKAEKELQAEKKAIEEKKIREAEQELARKAKEIAETLKEAKEKQPMEPEKIKATNENYVDISDPLEGDD